MLVELENVRVPTPGEAILDGGEALCYSIHGKGFFHTMHAKRSTAIVNRTNLR